MIDLTQTFPTYFSTLVCVFLSYSTFLLLLVYLILNSYTVSIAGFLPILLSSQQVSLIPLISYDSAELSSPVCALPIGLLVSETINVISPSLFFPVCSHDTTMLIILSYLKSVCHGTLCYSLI